MQITGAVLEESGRPGPYAKSRPLSISRLSLTDPGEGEALVAIEAAGVCHSDLSVVNGNRPRPLPMLLGHEASGRIVGLGPETTGFDVGDRVIMTFLPRCEACAGCAAGGVRPCLLGSIANAEGTLLRGTRRLSRDGVPIQHHLGVSGFATHTVVDTHSLVKVDSDLPADVAAIMGCAVLTGGGAVINALRPQSGETVVVVGLGGVGMAAVLTALAQSDIEVVAVDPNPEKLEFARELGVREAFTPDEASSAGVRGRAVLEAAGSARALEAAIKLTEAGGTTVTVGLPSQEQVVKLSPAALVADGRSLVGSYLGSAIPSRDIPLFVDLWRAGRLPVERLISSHIPLDRINEAMDALADGHVLRQIVRVDGS